MTRTEHLLTILAEECAEVAQRVSKALRFGLDEVQPNQPYTNAQRVVLELNDLAAAVQMAVKEGALPDLSEEEVAERIGRKTEKVERFLAFSAGRGLVDGVPADPTVPHPESHRRYVSFRSAPDTRVGGCPECPAILTAGLDGAETAYCPGCGYCTHPSQSAKDGHWHCNACNKQLEPLCPMVQG
jgi:hypothetical protein